MKQVLSRRALLTAPLALAAKAKPARFFRTEQRNGHWWLIAPTGEALFGIGMNHIDSATLRYAENAAVWRSRYGNSEKRWIEEGVAPNLRQWGFNSVGWVQEVVIRVPTIHRHSRNWGYEQYQWLGMPYCHLLPFAETHQWEVETRLPDFFSKDFEEWCDYVARLLPAHGGGSQADRLLLRRLPGLGPRRAGEMARPAVRRQKAREPTGRDELRALATRYYRVTHDAIRRYDRNHLILGDRYEAKAALLDIVLQAATPYVDVMSFQYFAGPSDITREFRRFHAVTGKPVLLADASRRIIATRCVRSGERRTWSCCEGCARSRAVSDDTCAELTCESRARVRLSRRERQRRSGVHPCRRCCLSGNAGMGQAPRWAGRPLACGGSQAARPEAG